MATVERFTNETHRCPACRERLHVYLFAYRNRRTGERDFSRCLPCKSAEGVK